MMPKEGLLSHFSKLTHKRYKEILRVFDSLDTFWSAPQQEIKEALRWKPAVINEYLAWRTTFNAEKANSEMTKYNVICANQNNPIYPKLLKNIFDPPVALFVRGKIQQDVYTLAIVGPRKPSHYGAQMAKTFTAELARPGVSIVSGLALGIDALVHEQAVNMSGHTVAVLGGGADEPSVAPKTNGALARRIVQAGGSLISESPVGTEPTKYSFPKRNRIISGMSDGVLIIEAGASSGALITASTALEQGRDVYAIPQNITSSTSIGTNDLLKHGAMLVTSPKDILERIALPQTTKSGITKSIIPVSEAEQRLLSILTKGEKHVDDIIRETTQDGHTVGSMLSLMEVRGLVKNIGNMTYKSTR